MSVCTKRHQRLKGYVDKKERQILMAHSTVCIINACNRQHDSEVHNVWRHSLCADQISALKVKINPWTSLHFYRGSIQTCSVWSGSTCFRLDTGFGRDMWSLSVRVHCVVQSRAYPRPPRVQHNTTMPAVVSSENKTYHYIIKVKDSIILVAFLIWLALSVLHWGCEIAGNYSSFPNDPQETVQAITSQISKFFAWLDQ